jgi:hypothetical protein
MTFDHARLMVFTTSEFAWMEPIGRLAFPIFAFQIVMGYRKTHDLKKYILRLLLFAVISEVPYKWMLWLGSRNLQLTFSYWNVYWTFILGIIVLQLLKSDKIKAIFKGIIITAICVVFSIVYVDYSIYGIGLMVAYYYLFPFKDIETKDETKKSIYLAIILAFLSAIFMVFINARASANAPISTLVNYGIFTFAGSVIPFLSNGKKGLSNKAVKWMFYIYYPLHITILCLINFFR